MSTLSVLNLFLHLPHPFEPTLFLLSGPLTALEASP
jgi:hypothetical protein